MADKVDSTPRRRPRSGWLKRLLTYPTSGLIAYLLYGLFALLPPATASAVGRYLGRRCGRWLRRRNRVALANLALLDLDPARLQQVLDGMWEHLGQVMTEYPHLRTIGRRLAKEIAQEHLLPDPGQPCVLCSAHIGNWELLLPTLYSMGYRNILSLYRHPNNPFIGWLVRYCRGLEGYELLPSDRAGIKSLFKGMGEGRWSAMLVDQKRDKGIASLFLGREAMTTTMPARLALRYRCQILVSCLVRIEGIRFQLKIAPIEVTETDDVQQITDRINQVLEGWVREHPEQWLWIHRRWPE